MHASNFLVDFCDNICLFKLGIGAAPAMAPIRMHDIQDLVLIVSPHLFLTHFSQNLNNRRWETISVLPPRRMHPYHWPNESTYFLLCNSWCVLKIMTLKVRSPNTYLPGPKKPINLHVAEVFTTTLHTISNDNLKVGTWLFLFCSPISSPARQHFFSSSSSFLPLPLAPQASFNFLIFLLFSSGHSHLIVSFIFLTLSSQLCLSSSSFVYPFELFRVLQASPDKQFLQFCFSAIFFISSMYFFSCFWHGFFCFLCIL